MQRSKPFRLLSALLCVLALAGCAGDIAERVNIGSVYPDTVALMESQNMDRGAPIFIRITKEDSTLEVWKEDREGRYRPLKRYPVCHYSAVSAPRRPMAITRRRKVSTRWRRTR